MFGWRHLGVCAAVIGVFMPPPAHAQNDTSAPLSAIDWLDKPLPLARLPRAPQTAPGPGAKIDEPSVASTGSAPRITIRPLDGAAPRTVGLVPETMTGIAPDLWRASETGVLVDLITDLDDLELPAANALLFTVLLANATVVDDRAQDALTRARVHKLLQLGAVDPGLALVEQAGGRDDPALFDLWADLSLLAGTEDAVCTVLARAPYLSRNIGLRIFCAARSGDWDTAALTLGSAKALALLPNETLDVLDRFLNPDLFEDAAPLPVPRRIDPLTFRLFETIGEPLPSGPLPRAYAVADLRDLRGWKSQLQAAERLTRAGALPDNRLLGLYTERKPAASGGIWDRVDAVQRFDAALNTRSAEAVAKTMPQAWRAMRDAGLEVSFAAAFHDRLAKIPLTGRARRTQLEIGLLSPDYELAALAGAQVPLGPHTDVILATATGTAADRAPEDALARAVHDVFAGDTAKPDLVAMVRAGRLGEALLHTLDALRAGARGDTGALRGALGTLRALGLEDTARRAALQILLAQAPR